MTYAAWEKMVRLFQPYETIWTELGYAGQVVKAWTTDGMVWPVKEWREKNAMEKR